MTTESERRLAALLNCAGFDPTLLGVDRDEAWAKFVQDGKCQTVTVFYEVDSTDESVARELCLKATRRGVRTRRSWTS